MANQSFYTLNTNKNKESTTSMQISRQLISKARKVWERYSPNPQAQEYRGKYTRNQATNDAPVIVVQCVEDYYYFALFAEIITGIRRQTSVVVEQLVLRSLREKSTLTFRGFITALIMRNRLTDNIWIKLYSSFCNNIAYRAAGFVEWRDLFDLKRAFSIWRSVNSKMDVINLVIDDIVVGDLIYDSYLRFKPAPTMNISDAYLLVVIWQSLRDIRQARRYFSLVRPSLFLTCYSTYIQHGIPVRVALNANVPVYGFGNYQEFAKRFTLEDWAHTANHSQYSSQFLRLQNQQQKYEQAEISLQQRTSGVIDAVTAYMRKSAYANTGEQVPDVNGAIVVFLHDFFDSPHCYQWMLFPDFYEWLTYTIELAQKHQLKLFIKPHPNELAPSKQVVEELRKIYPQIPFLSSAITNKQLIDAGMACGLTVYGTVAHELAFMGVPTICCGDHPHISFNFCFTAHTMAEYDNYLKNYLILPFDVQVMREESIAFYCMHNLNISENKAALLNAVAALRNRFYNHQDLPSLKEYENLVGEIDKQPEYQKCIDSFVEILQSKPHNKG